MPFPFYNSPVCVYLVTMRQIRHNAFPAGQRPKKIQREDRHMKITFHGAAKTVTGSQHLLEVNGRRILLDCGLFQGKRKEAFALNRSGFCAGKTPLCSEARESSSTTCRSRPILSMQRSCAHPTRMPIFAASIWRQRLPCPASRQSSPAPM